MTPDPPPYEDRLRNSFDFTLREASEHYGARGSVHLTLQRLAARLEAEGIPYAVIGALALAAHGYVRMTSDVDLVMTAHGLRHFRERCVGRGYRPAFSGAQRTFRDVETQVRIEVVESGAFPGDGKPKAVAFPDPTATEARGAIRVLPLATLIELKLASGLTAPHRLRDLADVQELDSRPGPAARPGPGAGPQRPAGVYPAVANRARGGRPLRRRGCRWRRRALTRMPAGRQVERRGDGPTTAFDRPGAQPGGGLAGVALGVVRGVGRAIGCGARRCTDLGSHR